MCVYATGSAQENMSKLISDFLFKTITKCILNSEIRQVLKGADGMKDKRRDAHRDEVWE